MHHWHLDYESRSLADLTVVGGWHYARHPSTEILCAAIRRNNEPVLVWSPIEGFGGEGAGQLLREMLADDGPVYAHNATGFEVPMTEHVLTRMGFPAIDRKRWRCTATMARRANIPPSLEKAAEALRLTNQKDKGGSALIKLFSIPRKGTTEFNDPREHPEQFRQFLEYCRQDVMTECDVAEALKHFELKGWLLDIFHEDISINGRGMPVNLDALRKAQALIEAEKGPAFAEFLRLTGLNPTQNAKLRVWFAENGLPLDNLQADTLEALQADPSTATGRAIELLQKLGFAAVKKVDTMIECAGPDDNFIRGSLQFYGAQATARWSGRLHQPQNFKRPEFAETEQAYEHICAGWTKGMLETWYDRPIYSIIASCIRHFIHDSQGPMLSADYSAIEARVIAWLAGEEWRLEVFRTHGKIYEASACQMFGLTMEQVTKAIRQKSKVAELALGYQGGVGALEKMGALDMGLTKEELPGLVKAWRAANPAITALWRACDHAARCAVEQPGIWFDARRVKIGVFAAAGAPYLFIKLPSGRCLSYRDPRIEWVRIPKPKDETPEEETERMAQGAADGKPGHRQQVTHFGPGSTAGGARSAVWGRATLYGGKIVENITQAVAFDLMANGTLVAARKGYRIYSLIHDEAMAAWDDRETQSIEDFQRCLESAPAWAEGLPLGTSGEVVPYYRK
jgi:DNA polymerase